MRGKRGFTFVELMVAVTIFSFAAASIYYTFSTGIDAYRRGERDNSLYREGKRALDVISGELRSAFVNRQNDAVTFSGTGLTTDGKSTDGIIFFTVKKPSFSAPWKDIGVYKVRYYLEKEDKPGFFTLCRAETPGLGKIGLAEETAQPLNANVTGLDFQYIADGEWLSEWQESTTLPKQVKITLFLNDGERDVAFTTIAGIETTAETEDEE